MLNKEIHSILNEHKGKFKDKSLLTRFSIPGSDIWIGGDEETFNHIFTNLISNAIKYTPVGGTIGVDLKVHDNWVTLDVWDTGIGIPQEYLNKVFDDFFRTPEAIDIDASGTGLGLAVIKHGVEFFGGSVEIQSPHERDPGQKKGTCFCLKFPVVDKKTGALEN